MNPSQKGRIPGFFWPRKWNLKLLTAFDFHDNIPGVMPQPAPHKWESSRESLLLSFPCQLNLIKSAKKLCASPARGCPSFFPWFFSSLYKLAPCYSLTVSHLEKNLHFNSHTLFSSTSQNFSNFGKILLAYYLFVFLFFYYLLT
jgi:hypothetical protein